MYETSDDNSDDNQEETSDPSEGDNSDFGENLDRATTSEVPDEQEDSLPVEPEVTDPRPTADATMLGN